MSARRKHFQPKPCAHCGTVFAPKSGVARFCDFQCKAKHHHKDRAAGLRSESAGMDPNEERKARARCRRRLLEGVQMRDMEPVFPDGMAKAVFLSLTEEERETRKQAQEAEHLTDLVKGITTGGDWRVTNTLTKWKGTMGGVFR